MTKLWEKLFIYTVIRFLKFRLLALNFIIDYGMILMSFIYNFQWLVEYGFAYFTGLAPNLFLFPDFFLQKWVRRRRKITAIDLLISTAVIHVER